MIRIALLFLLISLLITACVPTPVPVVVTGAPAYVTEPSIRRSPTPPIAGTERPFVPPTISPSILPTNTPQTGLSRVDRYQIIYYDWAPVALGYMVSERFEEAIDLWNSIIDALPDYGYAYYQRAECFQEMARIRVKSEDAQADLQLALNDNQKALELGPVTGDHYLQRYAIWWRLAWFEPLRNTRTELFEHSNADLEEAIRLGNSDTIPKLRTAFLALDLGHCQAALEIFSSLMEDSVKNQPSAGLNEGLARSYLCFGWLDAARLHIDLALAIQPTMQRRMTKIIIQINQGELNEALFSLNEWMEEDPYFYGERYYLRALVYHDLGEYEKSAADLQVGSTQVWGVEGLRHYVEALLALREGNINDGQRLLVLAEQTMTYDYGPLLGRVRREVGIIDAEVEAPVLPQIAAEILTATPVLDQKVAPADLQLTLTPDTTGLNPTTTSSQPANETPGVTSTAIPGPPLNTQTPEVILTVSSPLTVTASPVHSSQIGEPVNFPTRNLVVVYDGTGEFSLGTQSGGLTFYFVPPEPMILDSIPSLVFTLTPMEEGIDDLNLTLILFRYEGVESVIGSPGIALEWGTNKIVPAPGMMDWAGGVFVRVINGGGEPVPIKDLSLELIYN